VSAARTDTALDVSLFDFELPPDRIALRPVAPRDAARLLVVHEDGALEHAHVRDLPQFLKRGDILVANDSKVVRARLRAVRRRGEGPEGPKVELLLHKRVAADRFLAFVRPARKLVAGDELVIAESFAASVVEKRDAGEVEVAFEIAGSALENAIAGHGEMPLPPYIAGKRAADARDAEDYQTMFAAEDGSVAAPTAGLHFTPDLLASLEAHGIAHEALTLHVGAGTFLPVSAGDTAQHRMHAETAHLSAPAAGRIAEHRAQGGRVVAVGTTSLRTLETASAPDGVLKPFSGETDIFITPGYTFHAVDVLLTNFHLPRSTLFMLVCAFAGLDAMKRAYAQAIAQGYRFYSYGDACLLFRKPQ
jgi:S-adenosylmethionine:tRNA ribosyltransferase-isomerase